MEILPIDSSEPAATYRFELDQRQYLIRAVFNFRESKWYMELYDESNVPIACGIKITVNTDLIGEVRDARKPSGAIMALDMPSIGTTVQPPRDPGEEDLGERVKLVYFSAEEVASGTLI